MAITFTYAGSFSVAGTGIDGVTVNAWKGSRFTSAPAMNAAPPGGSPDVTATTGESAGYDGAFAIALPSSEDYYLSITYLGTTYWQGPVYGMFEDGTAQGGTATPGTISPPIIASPTVTYGASITFL